MDASVQKSTWPRRALTVLGVIVFLCLTLYISARVALRSDWGRAFVVSKIESSKPAGQSISIGGLEGDLMREFSVRHLEVADESGTWMSADDVTVTWSPLKLLRRTLDVAAVSAKRVDVLARPKLATSDTKSGSPLRRILAKDLRFPSLTIGGTLIAEPQTINLNASAAHSAKGGRLKINASSAEAVSRDTIDADVSWSPDVLITGNAHVKSLPGGIITTLLKLGAHEALTLDMTTQGTFELSETRIEGHLGPQSFAQAVLRMDGGLQFVTGRLDPSLIPALQDFAGVFGGEVEIDTEIDRREKSMKVEGALRSENLIAKGRAVKTDGGFELPEVSLISRAPMALFQTKDLSVAEVTFAGQAKVGSVQTASGRLEIKDIQYESYQAALISGPANVSLESGKAEFDVNLTGKVPSGNAARRWSGQTPRLNMSGSYNLETKAAVLTRGEIRLAGLELQATGRAGPGRENTGLEGRYVLAKGGLGTSLPAALSGGFSLKNQGADMHLDVSGTAGDFSQLSEPIKSLLGTSAAYKGRLLIGETNAVTLSQASLTSEGLSVHGTGRYSPDKTLSAEMSYNANAFEVGTLSVAATEGRALLSGQMDALTFDVTGALPTLVVSGRQVNDISYHLKGKRRQAVIEADVNIKAAEQAGTASLTSNARYEGGIWSLSEINSGLFGVSVTGDMRGQGGDLAALQTALKITGDPSQLIPADSVDVMVNLANQSVDISGALSGINVGGVTNAELALEANGPREAVKFSASLKGDTQINEITRPLDAGLVGTADLAAQYMGLTAALTGQLGQFEFKSVGPLSLQQSETVFGVAGQGRLSVFGGTVSYDLRGEVPILMAEGRNLTLAPMLAVAGRPGVDGTAEFDVKVRPEGEAWGASLAATLAGIKQPGNKAEPLNLQIDGELSNRIFSLTAFSPNEALTGEASLKGALDTRFSAPFILWPPKEPLAGTVNASGDIGSITELLLPPETDVEGIVKIDMGFNVPPDARGLTGRMSMAKGMVEQGAIGTRLTNIAFKSVFEGLSVTVTDFSAGDEKGGTLTGGGRMGLRSAGEGAISLTANKLHLFDRREGMATVSGQLDFTRNAEKLKLAGKLNVDDAQVNLDKFPRAGRPTLDVSFGDESSEDAETVRYATDLDVSLTSAGRIALRGSGVNASLAMDAKVTGPFEAPVFDGNASVVRGRFDFLGKRFELKDSKIVFSPEVMDSRLDVKAVRETTDLTATIEVTGTPERPEIKLSSNPTLPEDEVLSYILFGRSASQLTTLETARLAAALAQLSGGGGFDLLGGLENALGLDTLDVARSDTGQTELTTGKYLSEDVYVEVRSSAEGSPGLAVEWTPRKNISVEAETSPGETQSVSVQWQKDFD